MRRENISTQQGLFGLEELIQSVGSCQPQGAEINFCCGAGWPGGTNVFWTDQRYKYLAGLKAKTDKGLQAKRWEQGLHSDRPGPNKHSHIQRFL